MIFGTGQGTVNEGLKDVQEASVSAVGDDKRMPVLGNSNE